MEGNIRWQSLVNWRTLFFFIVLLLSFNLFLYPRRSQYMSAITGEKNPIIDTWGFYTPGRLFRVMGEMGETGRQFYALSEVSADFTYPLVYTPLLMILLAMVLPRAFPASRLLLWMVRLPLVICMFDFLENGGLFNLLITYPAQSVPIAWITAVFTLVKTIALAASLVLALVSLGVMGVNAIRGTGMTDRRTI